MIATRHRNGRGLVLDDADVNRQAHVSIDSIVKGNAIVRDARLINQSCADDDCMVFGGTLDHAYVGGKTVIAGSPLLAEETIARCKAISGSPRIYNSRLERLVEVFDSPVISNVYLHGAVMVYGSPKLIGPWILGGTARIHEGDWMRAPKSVKLEHTCITECVAGRILIECRCRTREYWLRHGPAFGRRAGWTEEQIAETLTIIEAWKI